MEIHWWQQIPLFFYRGEGDASVAEILTVKSQSILKSKIYNFAKVQEIFCFHYKEIEVNYINTNTYMNTSKVDPTTSSYTLYISEELKTRRIHPKFHVNRLRRHEPNNDDLFPHRDPKMFYDFGEPDETEWLVDEINAHCWTENKIEFSIRWNLGDITWEPYENCKDLIALQEYLDFAGVKHWRNLPRAPTRAAQKQRHGHVN
jgi:hypothetical protein